MAALKAKAHIYQYTKKNKLPKNHNRKRFKAKKKGDSKTTSHGEKG